MDGTYEDTVVDGTTLGDSDHQRLMSRGSVDLRGVYEASQIKKARPNQTYTRQLVYTSRKTTGNFCAQLSICVKAVVQTPTPQLISLFIAAKPPQNIFDNDGNVIDPDTRERLKKVLLSLQAFTLRLK